MTQRRARPSFRPIAEIGSFVALLALWLPCACEAVAPASAAVPRASGGSPLGELAAPSPAEERWMGVVEQTLAAKPYTYLAVRDGDALRWVAIMAEGPAPGTTVAIRSMGARRDFHSRRLDRTFDELVFGVIDDSKP